jgi:hypothetical protein
MKINCLSCGHNIDLDDAYADHYEGQIKCYGCDCTLEIRTEQSAVRYVRRASQPADTADSDGKGSDKAQGDGAAPSNGTRGGKTRYYKARNGGVRVEPPLSGGNVAHEPSASGRAA